ncbi:sulfite exporter TauE/SafE family protein [Nitrobacteraceae bacterium UC4446_H13]
MTGFGSSLILAPVLSIILGPVEAVAITLLIGISASASLIPRYLRHADRGSILPISLVGMVFLFPGVLSLNLVPADTIRHVIAYVMIAITLLMISPRISFRNSRWQSAIAGALSGLIMGATSMGGPPLVLYLAGQRFDPRQLKANIVVAVGVLELGAFLVITSMGQVDMMTLARFMILLPGFLAATHLAERILDTKTGERYHYVIFSLLLVTGIAAVIF